MLFSAQSYEKEEVTPALAKVEPKDDSHKRSPLDRFLSHLSEATVWIVLIALILILRSVVPGIIDDETTVWVSGTIIVFALIYYTVIYNYVESKKRRYIKDIADVIFIGILGTVAKDYGVYFFTLYILPIAAAAFALNIVNSLVIAVFASIFIAGNVFLNTQLFAAIEPYYYGVFQIGFLFLLTFFTRSLALQLRDEKLQRTYFEQRLKQADKKLENVEAIEEEFVSITTHQLNTPLSIIRGYSSMLLSGDAGKLNTKQSRYLKEIHGGSLRLAQLIKELLSVTHIESEIHGQDGIKLNLNNIVRHSVEVFKNKAIMRSIIINYKEQDKNLFVSGNEIQLEQVIENLLDNALKYSNNNTTITVSVGTETNKEQSETIIVSIKDEGIGIPRQDQLRIFQRFYRAANSKMKDAAGTGLGLYIVKLIIERHKGSINFTSSENQGTEFIIRLPLLTSKE